MTMLRRKAREVALKTLFAYEVGREENPEKLCLYLAAERNLLDAGIDYALTLVMGTLNYIDIIDKIIEDYIINWDIDRLSYVDKSILRYATYELLFVDDVPYKVTINEAIEIAHIYSTEGSGKFINGILDRVYKERVKLLMKFNLLDDAKK